MMEAAAAYYEVTGKDRLLHVMERMAEHIETFWNRRRQRTGDSGTSGNRAGTLRLYEVTGKENYKDLARYFIEQRGKDPDYFVKEREKEAGFTLIWMCITENIIRHMLLSMSRKKQ